MVDWNLFDTNPLWRDLTLGSTEDKLRKMADPEIRKALREEQDAGLGPLAGGGTRDTNRNGFASIEEIFIINTATERWRKYEGCTLAELAASQGKHVIDAFLDLVVDEDLRTEFQTELTDIDRGPMAEVIRSPLALPGLSDGGAHTKFITLGAYPTEFLIVHVRQNHVIDLEEAHWRLSTYQAYAAGLKDRGFLREGMPADIIVYDFEALRLLPAEIARDYPADEWRRVRKAEGYRYIMVNGEVTFKDGDCTNATPGHLLRHGVNPSGLAMAAE
jgi:N-acyl-D-aspartate/D-glutamate deacylase